MTMKNEQPNRTIRNDSGRTSAEKFNLLSCQILEYANRGLSRIDFIGKILNLFMDSSGCDAIEVRLIETGRLQFCELVRSANRPPLQLETIPCKRNDSGEPIPCRDIDADFERICEDIICGRFDPSLPFYTVRGSFWTGNTGKHLELSSEACRWAGGRTYYIGGDFSALAIIPFSVENTSDSLLLLKSRKQDYFTENEVGFYEEIAHVLGVAVSYWRAQVALRERIKELTCLYGIAKIESQPDISLEEIIQATTEILPPAWLHPKIACARIILDGHVYSTSGFRKGLQNLTAEIFVNGEKRGAVEVAYLQEMPELDEGPFLKEERKLIEAIAREMALIVERRHAEEDKERLHEQLRHADRLATIGQLAAGVAHELNEPLGSILGFAQLANRYPEIPNHVRQDVEKIIAASLHAREIVKKLLIFARESPPQKSRVNLNAVIEEALYFLESRCAKSGIEMTKMLASDPPEITADQSQLYQVLINLVVNSVQAMPNGGHLTIRTTCHDTGVTLIVEDTGLGIDEETQKKIFDPFFTTKDIDEGTGLGLSVIHGIITSHGGTIDVESHVGRGTKFIIHLPVDKSADKGSNPHEG
jgi:two-component system NtrC family sensor kinase